jgi:hypothetical protein
LLPGPSKLRDTTVEAILARFSDTANYPDESLTPYQEFRADDSVYYFTPGGFLYRKDPDTKEVGGFFCGYLPNEVWHYRVDES